MSKIIVRLRCATGIYRIEIEKDRKLIELKNKINELLNVPVEKQQIYLFGYSNDALNNDWITLDEYNMKNGCIIELKSEIKPTYKKSTNIVTPINKDGDENLEKKSATHNNGIKESVNNNYNSNANKSKNENDNKSGYSKNGNGGEDKLKKENNENEPNFKSFDYFLKLRGYNTTDLPLNNEYKSVYLVKGQLNKIPLSVTLKHQEYRHVDHLELMNIEEIKNFVHYWCYENHMLEQRIGWMYGYYKEDTHYNLGIRAVCECIYEPPQFCEGDQVRLLPDDFMSNVDLIAEKLGLEKIGIIFTHLPRKEYLASHELVNIAKLQLSNLKKNTHYTNYSISNFITCTISPDPLLNNEPITNAFMVSDLGMSLIRDNLIDEIQDDPSHIKLRSPNKHELLPQILEGGKETNKFDTDWFIIRVNDSAPKVVRSIFKNYHFPRENRNKPQTVYDVKEYFSSSKLDRGVNGKSRCSDFHLIIFAAKVLDIETALVLCDAVVNNKEIDPIIEEMLTSIVI
ncbi:nuclear protein localization protein 4, putative [Plasmodium chabaudi chabaudi]|uniref:Nuclear protein localization protein 4, putative n=1 Tax=Plasmodium chabaudi chabaudi TaxID=31271 RepID=A0A1C6YJ00_PLACU|nr:nuclear protein localization protein 4, putative [Plasmodium chabaudi chabaudi]